MALPVGLVSAAGHVSRSQLALPSQMLQLVSPERRDHGSHKPGVVARHASSWPTRTRRADAQARLGRRAAAAESTAALTPALVRQAPATGSPGMALAQPAVQPRTDEHPRVPEVVAPLPSVTTPRLPGTLAAPGPSAPPVAEAATAPSSAPVAEPAPVPAGTTPAAPSSPVIAKPLNHEHDQHEEGGGD